MLRRLVLLTAFFASSQLVETPLAWSADPSWMDRGIGARTGRHLSRAERRRWRYTPYNQAIPGAYEAALTRLQALELDPRLKVERIYDGKFGDSIYRIEVPAAPRGGRGRGKGSQAPDHPLRVALCSGLHGSEQAGPLLALELVDHALRHPEFREQVELSLCVRLDPHVKRLRPDEVNLNRRFGGVGWVGQTRAIRRAFFGREFDLAADLHQAGLDPKKKGTDHRHGAFLIRGVDDGELSRRILGAVETAALWDPPAGKNAVGPYVFHALGGASTATEGTFARYMSRHGTPFSYTLETPRTLRPEQQLKLGFKLLLSTIHNVKAHGRK